MGNKNVIIDGVEFEPVKKDKEDIRIVVLQRGWVAVGYYSCEGEECKLRKAAIVRVWGTTNGLPQIANDGPIANKTIMDKCNYDLTFHRLTEVFNLKCNHCAWESKL